LNRPPLFSASDVPTRSIVCVQKWLAGVIVPMRRDFAGAALARAGVASAAAANVAVFRNVRLCIVYSSR